MPEAFRAAPPEFDQNTSFEIEVADAFCAANPPPTGTPGTQGLDGPFSIYHLAKPIAQTEDWWYYGHGSGRGLRHNVADNSLYFQCSGGGDFPCTDSGNITGPEAVQLNLWQLIEIHRDAANAIRVVINGTDVTLPTPLNAGGSWCYHDAMSRSKGDKAMFGDMAASLVYNDLNTEAERAQIRTYLNDIYNFMNAPPPPPDSESPSTPQNLAATPISPSQIRLTWNASTDNVGVTGYTIMRDGIAVGNLTRGLIHGCGACSPIRPIPIPSRPSMGLATRQGHQTRQRLPHSMYRVA